MAYELKIDGFNVKLHPCSVKDTAYKDCDSEGNPIKKKQLQKSRFEWQDTNGDVVTETFKLNPKTGKAMTKLTRTSEVKMSETVPKSELKDALTESTYIVETDQADLLRQKLKDQAMKFLFTAGNGFKVSKALLYEEDGKFWVTLYRKTKSEFSTKFDELKDTADFEAMMGKGLVDAPEADLQDLM